jgi:hypothetical protein
MLPNNDTFFLGRFTNLNRHFFEGSSEWDLQTISASGESSKIVQWHFINTSFTFLYDWCNETSNFNKKKQIVPNRNWQFF